MGTAALKLAAGRAADLVDRASVFGFGGAEVDAAPVFARRECNLAEMSGLDGLGEILPPDGSPADEIALGDQDGAVAACSAANSTFKAIQRFAHAFSLS